MPRLKVYAPESLEDLCLSAVLRCLETDLFLCEIAKGMAPSSLLLRQIDLSLTKIANELSDYMSFLPGTLNEMVRQRITTRVLQKYTETINTQAHDTASYKNLPLHSKTLRLLEIVLDEDIRSFDLSDLQPNLRTAAQSPAPGEPELWELLLGRCTGLQKFTLPPSVSLWFQTNLNSFITLLAQQCTFLTEIILKDGVQEGKVLAALSTHCPSLRVIDLSGSLIYCSDILYLIFPDLSEAERIAQYGARLKKTALVPTLPKRHVLSQLCGTLRELNVSKTKVKALGAYYALKYLPHLETLGECYYVASALKKRSSEDSSATCKLQHVYCRGLTNEKIKMVCTACPDLESLFIGFGEDQFTCKLNNLRKLHNLRSLTLEAASSLDLTGLRFIHELNHLELEMKEVDVGQIAEACPMLERLIIHMAPKKTFTLSEEHEKLPLFENLQELQVNCPVSVNVVAFIITKATLLRTVKLIRVKNLSDQILNRWLITNPLVHLETWLLTYAHLTIISVSLLISRCPNLTTIGRLSGWDIRSWESRRLQRTWQAYDLNLVLFTPKQDVAKIMDATASSDEES